MKTELFLRFRRGYRRRRRKVLRVVKKEILKTLGEDLGTLYCNVYDITEKGNFEGKNIPNLIHTKREQIKADSGLTDEELSRKLEDARLKLLKTREERTYPHVDDKVLTSWNALMIAGLAKAAKVFQEPQYLTLAKDAITFIENNVIIDGRVMVRYRDGEVKNKGFIDDYAFLSWAYLDLYEASFDLSYLEKAKKLSDDMIDLFWDEELGGFYFTGHDAEALIVREKKCMMARCLQETAWQPFSFCASGKSQAICR